MKSNEGISHNLDELSRKFQRLSGRIRNPQKVLHGVGLVLLSGFMRQFETQGKHWSTPWHTPGVLISRIREWQGISNYRALNATGTLKRSFSIAMLGPTSMVVGTPLKYAVDQHTGTGSSNVVVFRKFSGAGMGGSATWHARFPRIWARNLLPINGLTGKEDKAIDKVLLDGMNEAVTK